MENSENIISLASRNNGENDKRHQLVSAGVSALIFTSELIWFTVRRNRGQDVQWWEILILVISSIFLFFSLVVLLFARSNSKYNQKIMDKPLIAYDKNKKVFIVQSVAEKKEVEFERNDIDCVSINSETDEVTLNYLKNGKKKILIIGYADYSRESQINQSIEEIKKE